MNKIFTILISIFSFSLSQENIIPYMNCGLLKVSNSSGLEMGMFIIPKQEDKRWFKFCGGYGSFTHKNNNDGYEDYTSVLGTVNVYNDRFDGEFSIIDSGSFGGYFYSPLSKDNRFFLLTQVGYFSWSESFYNKYYDSYEILGNNGHYYSESSTPDNKLVGLEFGPNFYFSLSNSRNSKYENRYFWYGYLGYSLSTIDISTVRFGIGVSF